MSQYHKEWARRARAELLALLGPVCANPDCRRTEDLQFDCIEPMGDEHHRGSTDQRMCFYRRQHFEFANLQVLCGKCNARKADNIVRYPRFELEMAGAGGPF